MVFLSIEKKPSRIPAIPNNDKEAIKPTEKLINVWALERYLSCLSGRSLFLLVKQ